MKIESQIPKVAFPNKSVENNQEPRPDWELLSNPARVGIDSVKGDSPDTVEISAEARRLLLNDSEL